MARTIRHFCRTALSLLLLACGDNLNLPSEGDPGTIEAVGGNGQTGLVGSSLADSLIVRVTDAHDRPIQNQPIGFVLLDDLSGQLFPDTVLTDESGRAAAHWWLGTGAGTQQVEARVIGATERLAVTFTATADPAPPNLLALVSGDDQEGLVGETLPESLVVVLSDEFGNLIAGTDVQWSARDGVLSDNAVTTGVDGRAAVQWTLGALPGTHQATARYAGVTGSPVIFTAEATPAPSPQLAILIQPPVTAIGWVPFSRQPRLQIQDHLGNPIQQGGIAVTASLASGGGVLGGTTTVNSDATGRVQYTDLFISGPPGKKTIIFAASGHISITSDSIDLVLPPPSATRSTVVATPVTIVASTGSSSSTITVTVRDKSGNLIPGIAISLAATGNGNQLTQPGLTNANGVATGSLSSTVSESKTISATAANIGLAQTPTVTVGPGVVNAATSTASVPAGKVFQPTVIVVTARDQWGNRLITGGANVIVTVTGANPRTPFTATDNGNGIYTGAYFPFLVGQDTIQITLNGTAISGSPYTSSVGP